VYIYTNNLMIIELYDCIELVMMSGLILLKDMCTYIHTIV
jgi:hypothetical protein